jgi:hypothetical protein
VEKPTGLTSRNWGGFQKMLKLEGTAKSANFYQSWLVKLNFYYK